MVMTTIEARKTLATIERVIGMVQRRRGGIDAAERRVLQRLVERRSALLNLIAAREVEREKQIVSFALWRGDALPFGAGAV